MFSLLLNENFVVPYPGQTENNYYSLEEGNRYFITCEGIIYHLIIPLFQGQDFCDYLSSVTEKELFYTGSFVVILQANH